MSRCHRWKKQGGYGTNWAKRRRTIAEDVVVMHLLHTHAALEAYCVEAVVIGMTTAMQGDS